GTISPRVETRSSPARIVVHLPNTVLTTSVSRIQVGNNGVTGVRIGTDATATTRVVVDLERPCKYELVPGPGEKLTLKLCAGSIATQTARAEPKAPVTAAALAVPSARDSEVRKTEATDFAFVEPSYTPKKGPISLDPPARVVEAASKFVERPEGNLLPVANAAIQPQAPSSAPAASQPATPAIQPAVNMAAEQKTHQQVATGPKYTGEPISVNLKDVDLKDFFRLIHEI